MASNIASIKKLFFDRKGVLDAVDKSNRVALSKFGAFVRTRARSSIKTKKGVSAPGSPPFGHTGKLKGGILFAYDPSSRSVVIGPTRFTSGRGDAPRLLESGGIGVAKGRPAKYRPRPFMGPAFAAELPRAAPQFKAAFKG